MLFGVDESKIIIWIIGMGFLLFLVINRNQMGNLPKNKLFLSGYCILFTGWNFDILETFVFKEFFNIIQHLCFSVSSIILTIWCWFIFVKEER
jgi:hypothetical protein